MKDEEELLQLCDRLQHADHPYESKHPVVLPKKHPVTYLVIKGVDEGLEHESGEEHVLTWLRCRFWVIRGRAAVRKVINHCQMCRSCFNAKPFRQMMAPLPKSRVTSTLRAFKRVGVDFGSPYLTKQGRGKARAKRYLCLFTCLVTRGVHLEMAYHLDTGSFLNAFSQFVSRRGIPFVRLCFPQQNSFHWTNLMIKCAKKAIRGVLGNAEVTDEELLTAICGA